MRQTVARSGRSSSLDLKDSSPFGVWSRDIVASISAALFICPERKIKVTAKNVTSSRRNGIYKPHNPIGIILKNTDKASANAVILLLCLILVFTLAGQGAERAGTEDGVRVGAASTE